MILGERGKKALSTDEIRHRMHDFWAGRWGRLLPQPVTTDTVQTYQDTDVPAAENRAPRLPAPEAVTGPDPHTLLAAELLEQGDKGRAARVLVSPGLAERSWASFVQLWHYHPPGSGAAPEGSGHHRGREERDALNTTAADQLPADSLIKILRQSGMHGAGGPSR